ncbi:ABC-three component system middle component 7 [Malaciobacter marinus]|uniref:ABC-three component system middle component 7 n=1 Tax=Malaciobacter marinus TaxID=505249 RepID=UPI003AFF7588
MLFPSKFTNYEASVINKAILILECRDKKRVNVNTLYKELEKKYKTIDEYIYSLNLLFVLGFIELDNEEIVYVS